MLENGKEINLMGKVLKHFKMVRSMMVSLKVKINMVKVFTNGTMGLSISVIGKTI